MSKFWPALKTFKGGKRNKLVSDFLHYRMNDWFFWTEIGTEEKSKKGLADVPGLIIKNPNIGYRDIEITIDIDKMPKQYKNFNWANVNYFKSDFNTFDRQVEQSYWYVRDIKFHNYNDKLGKVTYFLHLDEFHTFYDYFKDLHGSINILQMHNERFIREYDEKGLIKSYKVNYLDNPYIMNCIEICKSFNNKQSSQLGATIYSSKHFNFDMTPKNNDFFNIDENGVVTKQLRGWIIMWLQDVTIVNTTRIGDVAMPYLAILYPVYDDFDVEIYNNEITQVLNIKDGNITKYTIEAGNIIGDIIRYQSLIKWSENDKFYIGNGSELLLDDELLFIEKEIFNNEGEPHLDSMTHKHFELQSPAKTSLVFTSNQLKLNNGLNELKYGENDNEFLDIPLELSNDIKEYLQNERVKRIPNLIRLKDGRMFFVINFIPPENWEWMYSNSVANDVIKKTKSLVMIANTWDFEEFLKIAKKEELIIEDRAFNLENFRNNNGLSRQVMVRPDKSFNEYFNTAKAVYDSKFEWSFNGIYSNLWFKGPSNIFKHRNNLFLTFRKFSATKASIAELFLETTLSDEWLYPNTLYVKGDIEGRDSLMQLGIRLKDISQTGNPNNFVIAYNFKNFTNNKFNADEWYVWNLGNVYKMPIGKLTPRTAQIISNDQEYYYENEKISIFARQISFFSNEQMGIKTYLLDTQEPVSYKINNNKMVLDIQGNFIYPYRNDAFNEWNRQRANQMATSFNNINSKQAMGQKHAWMDFGTGLIKGIAGGAAGGSIIGGPLGAIGGAISGLVTSAVTNGMQVSQRIEQINLDAEISRNSLNAQINDARNLPDNIHTTGVSSTLQDLELRKKINSLGIIKNYWNYWLPTLAIYELLNTDKETIRQHFNKYGYTQNRTLTINRLKDLQTRFAFNRIKLANGDDLMLHNGFSHYSSIDTIEELNEGIWLWNIDNIDYDKVLDFSINNVEQYIYQQTNPSVPLESQLEKELIG